MLAKDTKPGAIVNHDGAPLVIESVTVQSPSARGGTTLYKFRARNLVTKQKVDLACKGTDNFADADFQKRAVTLMYADHEHVHLLDQQDYNQYAVPREELAGELPYITEGLEGMLALIYNDQCVGLQLPAAVALKITQCDPAVKGDLKEGEVVSVDTRSGAFLRRA
jgi:elongation factor P